MTIHFKESSLPLENVYGHSKKLRLIRKRLSVRCSEPDKGLRILDIGCGNGSAVTRFLAHEQGLVTGIDMHEPSIFYAETHFGGDLLEFRKTTAEHLDFENKTFDAVILSDILEHVDNPAHLLKQALRLVKSDGRIFVSIPNGFGPFELESLISRLPVAGNLLLKGMDLFIAVLNKFIFKGQWNRTVKKTEVPYNEDSGHIQFFTKKKINTIIRACGLVILRQKNLSFLSGPFTNYLFAPSQGFCRLNNTIADIIPGFLVSAWIFELRRP